VRLFLALICAAAVSAVVGMTAHFLFPHALDVRLLGYWIALPGNLTFLVTLVLLIAMVRRISLTLPSIVLSEVAFVALGVASALLGIMTFERWKFAAILLLGAVGTIGYYPSGADVPFEGGAQDWALSVLLLINMGLLIGAGFRRLRLSRS
jgi:hypothetical protein